CSQDPSALGVNMPATAHVLARHVNRARRLNGRQVCVVAAAAVGLAMAAPATSFADTAPAQVPAAQKWHVSDFPADSGGLNAVATDGSATVAVGFGMTPSARFTPLAGTWDGDSWQRQPVRMFRSGFNVQLADV